MARILVTGGAGFLGSYLCERLLALRHDVTAFDMADAEKISGLLDHPKFRFVQDSILNTPTLRREIERADIVVHFAAIADPKRYVADPLVTLRIDLHGALNVFQFASEHGAKVIFASTSEVYGRNPKIPWREDADRVLGPTHINRWCYATAKAAGEHYCYAYAQQEGLRFVIYRFFNVYGPRLDDLGSGRVLPIFLNQCFQGEPMTIHGDGSQTRTFVYVEDAADCVVRGIFHEAAEGQVFNVGSSDELSIRELAETLKVVGGFNSPIITVPHREVFGPKYEDIPRRVPDVTKVKQILGWEATTSLQEGLEKTIAYYRETLQRSQTLPPEPPRVRPATAPVGTQPSGTEPLSSGAPTSGTATATLVKPVSIRALEWDTRHFGLRMGTLEYAQDFAAQPHDVLLAGVRHAVNEASTAGFQQLTARAAIQDILLIHVLEEFGFRFVDALVTYEYLLEHATALPPVTTLPGTAVRAAVPADAMPLMALARKAFADRRIWLDRFHCDPRIPQERADELYAQWIKNSIAPENPADAMADHTLVATVNDQVAGFLTCQLKPGPANNQIGIVSLNAVDAPFRGRGVYKSLVVQSIRWFKDRHCTSIRVRSSLASHAVRRTWMHLGALPTLNEYTFHWWA